MDQEYSTRIKFPLKKSSNFYEFLFKLLSKIFMSYNSPISSHSSSQNNLGRDIKCVSVLSTNMITFNAMIKIQKVSHIKDHDGWNTFKKKLDALPSPRTIYFYAREVWFCSIGHNIGHEEDGKIPDFSRPVIIIKKCGPNLFIGIPLTSKIKNARYYFNVGSINYRPAMAMMAQMRLFSSKRLINKIDTIPETVFNSLKKATKKFIF